MNTFVSMNSLRNEDITKKRSKDIRGTIACFKRKIKEKSTFQHFSYQVLIHCSGGVIKNEQPRLYSG